VQCYPFVVCWNDAKWNLEKRFSDFAALDAQLDKAQKSGDFGDAQVTFSHFGTSILVPPSSILLSYLCAAFIDDEF